VPGRHHATLTTIMADQDEYVRFDEIDDVISSVELLALVIPLLKEQPSF
jgi:hypothetical protein